MPRQVSCTYILIFYILQYVISSNRIPVSISQVKPNNTASDIHFLLPYNFLHLTYDEAVILYKTCDWHNTEIMITCECSCKVPREDSKIIANHKSYLGKQQFSSHPQNTKLHYR